MEAQQQVRDLHKKLEVEKGKTERLHKLLELKDAQIRTLQESHAEQKLSYANRFEVLQQTYEKFVDEAMKKARGHILETLFEESYFEKSTDDQDRIQMMSHMARISKHAEGGGAKSSSEAVKSSGAIHGTTDSKSVLNEKDKKQHDEAGAVGEKAAATKHTQRTQSAPAAPRTADVHVIDFEAGLALFGEAAVHSMMLRAFMEGTCDDLIKAVRDSLEARNWNKMSCLLHDCKGNTAQIGARQLHAATIALQNAMYTFCEHTTATGGQGGRTTDPKGTQLFEKVESSVNAIEIAAEEFKREVVAKCGTGY